MTKANENRTMKDRKADRVAASEFAEQPKPKPQAPTAADLERHRENSKQALREAFEKMDDAGTAMMGCKLIVKTADMVYALADTDDWNEETARYLVNTLMDGLEVNESFKGGVAGKAFRKNIRQGLG